MGFLRSCFVLVAAFTVLFSPLTHAFEKRPGPPSLDYNTVIDVLPLADIRAAIAKAWTHGMNPKLYWTDEMESNFNKGDSWQRAMKPQANQNFLQLLKDLSVGGIDPATLTPDIKFTRKNFLSAKQLQAVIVSTGQKADLLVESLAPQNPPYIALKAALARLYPACTSNGWVNVTRSKKVLKEGVRDGAVTALKKRLMFLGYPIGSLDDLFDQQTVAAVNDIEWNLHITPDGALHPAGKVWDFLMVSCMDRVHQIQADMEKMRWFPQYFADRFIMINLAFTYFIMMDKTNGQNVVTSFRTINGRPDRKSPTMKDEIVRVIFNPFWIVPPTVFLLDKVKEIKGLQQWQIRDYFAQHNYEVWNHNFTRQIDPQTINWWAIHSAADANFFIRQRPNYMNALGVVKFELTNSFSVYMHDTNQRELFAQPMRLLSSGCIRLEKPLDLAEYLLQGTTWDRPTIENVIAKPGEVLAKDTPVNLKNPIAVYTVYLTSQMSSDNILRFTDDIYGQNADVLSGFQGAL